MQRNGEIRRRTAKLLLTMLLIGCVHAGILFVAYGRKWLAFWPYYGGGIHMAAVAIVRRVLSVLLLAFKVRYCDGF